MTNTRGRRAAAWARKPGIRDSDSCANATPASRGEFERGTSTRGKHRLCTSEASHVHRRQGRSSCHIATAAITQTEPTEEPTEEPSPPSWRCNYSISNKYHNTGIILLWLQPRELQCLLAEHSPFAMPQSVQCPSAAVARTGMDVFTQPRVFVTLNMTVVQAYRLGHVPPDR